MVDNLGDADLLITGTRDIRTPNIDRIFEEGITFLKFYTNNPVCSPSRAALLSGCFPDKVGVPGVIRDVAPNSWGNPKKIDIRLLLEILQNQGVETALVGKWHLGLSCDDIPNKRGFDFFHGFLSDMMDDYWNHRKNGLNLMRKNQLEICPRGHATDVFTKWAFGYIAQREGKIW